jgi:hypothetical protein
VDRQTGKGRCRARQGHGSAARLEGRGNSQNPDALVAAQGCAAKIDRDKRQISKKEKNRAFSFMAQKFPGGSSSSILPGTKAMLNDAGHRNQSPIPAGESGFAAGQPPLP